MIHPDDDFFYDSLNNQCNHAAMITGENQTDVEWLLTDLDSWIRNPFFKGIPSGRHPEDGSEDDYQPIKEPKKINDPILNDFEPPF